MMSNMFGYSKPLLEGVLINFNQQPLSFNVEPIRLLEIALAASTSKSKVMELV
jgi:hypothetical protein